MVVKPSELAPVAVLELARIFTAAGLPAGVLNVVCGLGAVAGKALAEHATVAKLDLTGGTETGMLAAAAASRNLARVCMELGGNAPVLVFADADLEQAVNGAAEGGGGTHACPGHVHNVSTARPAGVAFGAFVASGQTCISAKRVLVQEALLPAFRERLVAKAKGIVLGDPMAAGTQMGPLVSELQMRRVLSLVETAAPQGATLLCGGVRSSAAGCEAGGGRVEPAEHPR